MGSSHPFSAPLVDVTPDAPTLDQLTAARHPGAIAAELPNLAASDRLADSLGIPAPIGWSGANALLADPAAYIAAHDFDADPGRDSRGPVDEDDDLLDEDDDDDGLVLIAGILYDAETLDEAGEPWTEDDTAELAEAMRHAADNRARDWSAFVAAGRSARADTVDLWTVDELREVAHLYGLVPDRPADLDAYRVRQRELISEPLDERRIASSTYQSSHHAFEQRHAIATGAAIGWPIYALGLALAENRAGSSCAGSDGFATDAACGNDGPHAAHR